MSNETSERFTRPSATRKARKGNEPSRPAIDDGKKNGNGNAETVAKGGGLPKDGALAKRNRNGGKKGGVKNGAAKRGGGAEGGCDHPVSLVSRETLRNAVGGSVPVTE